MFRFSLLLITTGALAAERVVINEIHFHPADKKPLEFVELFNVGDQPAKLTGWALDKYRFPAGTEIAPGGHLVIAQDPAALEKEHGVKALGPLGGKLSNEGEKITLKNAAGAVVEQFKYGVGFPWPAASAGEGSSMERTHPLLPATNPGAWRASGFPAGQPGKAAAIIPPGSAGWRWRKGTSEASQPPDAWRAAAFQEGADWQNGKAGFGYADGDDATVLEDMAGRYTSLNLRHRFSVAKLPGALIARVRVDDGCILWLNGKEMARLHTPAGEPKFDSLAEDHESGEWEEVAIPNAGQFLVPGENVLAAQVFNSAKDSSDLSFDLTLLDAATAAPLAKLGKKPTPGAANSVLTGTVPVAFSSVRHDPPQPRPGQAVRISVSTGNPPAQSATLHVQVVEPGAYVRKTDPEYETRWEQIPMRPTVGGWVADVPAEMQKNRRLVRYRVTAENVNGLATRIPYLDDPCPNFAYYVWAGPQPWTAAAQPGKPPITFPAEMQQSLQTFTLIASGQDVSRSQWDGGANHQRFHGTFVYEGKVLDHMQFKNRGSASTYVTGKNKWGFRFLHTHELAMRDQWGNLYGATWNSFAMNACASPWVQINRGMAGLDEVISFRAYQLAGVPASDSLPVQLRVVTTPEEQGKTQYDGDGWGLYVAIEDLDGAWLDNHAWPDGVIVKPEDGVKHVPGGYGKDPGAVWGEFQSGPRGDKAKWWREHMDMQSYYSFHAINRLVSNVDVRPGANHAFYQHPEKGWMPVPWDLDMQFIPRTHQPGYIDQASCLNVPELKLEYQNRAREILDLLASDATPDGGQIGQLVAEYARHIEPRSGAPEWSWAMLDMHRWNHAPQTNDKGAFYRNPAEQQMMGGSFQRTLLTPDFAGFCKFVVDFCTDSRPKKDYSPNDGNPLGYGYGHLLSECRDEAVPARPTIAQGAGLSFSASDFADPQGAASFAGIQWRIAEIGRPARGPWMYEITPRWTSGTLPAAGVKHTFPAGICVAGRTYRVRARYLDNTGRWSHWSAPVQFVAKP